MTYFTGKGYGVSDLTDLSGKPLLTYQGPNDKQPILLSDRCAVEFDPTIPQTMGTEGLQNTRMPDNISQKIRKVVGAGADDEVDHKIPLELGGSNMLSNLQVQPGIKGGLSASSDTIETTLAARVHAGQISLQFAWQAMALQKGFVLGEEAPGGVEFSLYTFLPQLTSLVGNIATGVRNNKPGTIASETQAQLDQNIAILKENPLNIVARQNYIIAQIAATQQKTGVSQEEAGAIVKTMLTSYAQTSGLSKADVLSALTPLSQRLLQTSKTAPTILGVESTSIIKGIFAVSGVSALAAVAGAVLIIVGIFAAGPEEVAAAGVGFALNNVVTAFGLSFTLGAGVTLVALLGMITGISFLFGFIVKEYYDNAILAPTQEITALKDVLGIEKTIGVGLQMTAATHKLLGSNASGNTGVSSSLTSGASFAGSGGGGGNVKLFTGVIANGKLGASTSFKPDTSNLISSPSDLHDAAKQNLAAYVLALPGQFYWEIGIVNTVKSPTGFTIRGTVEKVQTGTHKDGTPIYKTYYKKFAVLRVGIKDVNGHSVKLNEINLGPVNSTSFSPSASDLAGISAALTPDLFTSDVTHIDTIVTPSPVTVQHPLTPQEFSVALSNGTIKTQADLNTAQGTQTAAVAAVTPPPAPQSAPVATPITQQSASKFLTGHSYRVSVGGSVLNMRSSPSLSGAITFKVPDGTMLKLDTPTIPNIPAQIVTADGYNWVFAIYDSPSISTVGWVASEYLV